MAHFIKQNWILAAAVAGVTLIGAANSQAQYRIDNGGARDANNRVGGNGSNDNGSGGKLGASGVYGGVSGNDIVLGNVTGGKEFHGHINYSDPGGFRGFTASRATDAFVKGSSAAPYGTVGGVTGSNAQTVRPFFGDSRGVNPPAGYQQANIGTPGYIPAPMTDQRIGSDLRLGDVNLGQSTLLPQPGETVLPGPVDSSMGNQTLIMASSLYGVRPFNAGNTADQSFVQRYNDTFNGTQSSISDQELNADRGELMQASPLGQNTTITNPNALQNGQQPADANQTPNAPLSSPTLNNGALPANQLQSNSLQTQPLSGGLATGQSSQTRVLMPAAAQSAANATLQQRLQQNANGQQQQMTDVQAAQQYNRDMLAAKNAAANAKNGGLVTGNVPGQPRNQNGATNNAAPNNSTPNNTGANNATPNTPTGGNAQKSPPPKIESLYQGVKAKGLGDLLKDGEDLMKQGKWYDAIQKYDTAQQVAPNNMLILVGRANAELGASSYGPAEADLRTAFTQDPAMMEGQFDLRKMVGDDRLQFLVNDLKAIQSKNPDEARPVFLLSYIYYNTGNERMAAGYLDLAEKRAGGSDTFYSMVRNHWTLPAGSSSPATQPTLNK